MQLEDGQFDENLVGDNGQDEESVSFAIKNSPPWDDSSLWSYNRTDNWEGLTEKKVEPGTSRANFETGNEDEEAP